MKKKKVLFIHHLLYFEEGWSVHQSLTQLLSKGILICK